MSDSRVCLVYSQRWPHQKIGVPIWFGYRLDWGQNYGSPYTPWTFPRYFRQFVGAPSAWKTFAKELASSEPTVPIRYVRMTGRLSGQINANLINCSLFSVWDSLHARCAYARTASVIQSSPHLLLIAAICFLIVFSMPWTLSRWPYNPFGFFFPERPYSPLYVSLF